jgi:hypothetical protein
MRALVMTLAVLAVGCSSPSGNDGGGSGGGAGGSGGGSGGGAGGGSGGQVCLEDRFDAGPPLDGGNGTNFSCFGAAPGEGGQAELIILGNATRAGFTRTGLPDVQLDLLSTSGAVLATTVSDVDGGAFRLTFDAGCAPLEGEVRATHLDPDAGFYLSYAVPAEPWRYDRSGLELVLFDGLTRGLAAQLAGVTIQNDTAVLALSIDDCDGKPVLDAVVRTADDAGVVRYVGPSGLPTTLLSATGTRGEVVIFNLPGTSADVIATIDGGVIARRVIPVHANAATGSTLHP